MDRRMVGAIAISPTREEGLAGWDPWLACSRLLQGFAKDRLRKTNQPGDA